MHKKYWAIVGFLVLMLSAIILVAIAAANIGVKLGKVSLGRLCFIPIQNITLEASPVNTSVLEPIGFEVLYYKCNYTSCSDSLSSKILPVKGGRLALGPSLLHMVLLKTAREALPPSTMKSAEPGVLELEWFYPTARAHAIVVVEASNAIMFLPANYSKLHVYVPGCMVNVVGRSDEGVLYNVSCSYNIAAVGELKLELVESKLKSIVVDLNGFGCTNAVGMEVVRLRLPALALATLLAAVMAGLVLREIGTL